MDADIGIRLAGRRKINDVLILNVLATLPVFNAEA
jgi:hypothetical protein